MKGRLEQSDLADLSAWFDGELSEQRAEQIARLVTTDPAWRQAAEELKALDSALDAWRTPQPADDLSERICTAVRATGGQARKSVRILRWLGPAAGVAAAIVLIVIFLGPQQTPLGEVPTRPTATDDVVLQVLADLPPEDRLIVEHLDFIRNYELCNMMEENGVLDAATLEALDSIETQGI